MTNQNINDVDIITTISSTDRILVNTDVVNNVLEQIEKDDFVADIISTDSGNLLDVGTDNKLSVIDSTITLQGNTFNGNSQLVKTTSAGLLPALDGSNLTNITTTFNGCRLKRSATQAVATGTATAIQWNVEDFDTNSFHDISTNPTRITIPANISKIKLTAGTAFAANSTGNRSTYIYKNGSALVVSTSTPTTSAGELQQNIHSGVIPVSKNDYFEVFVIQSSGGNLNINGNVEYVFFSLEVVD